MNMHRIIVAATVVASVVISAFAGNVHTNEYGYWMYDIQMEKGVPSTATITGYASDGKGHPRVESPASVLLTTTDPEILLPVRFVTGGRPVCETLVINGDGNLEITADAFRSWEGLHNLELKGVKTVQGGNWFGPFQGCTNLETLTGDAALKTIGSFAFDGCTKLKYVNNMKGLREIKWSAFKGCTALEAMPLYKGLEMIEGDAFNSCASLLDVSLPDSVTNIGYFAYRDCSGVTNIVFGAGYSPIQGARFSSDMPNLQTLTVHGNGKTEVTAEAFGGFPMRRVSMTGVKLTRGGNPAGSFSGCPNLTEVVADGSLETLGTGAFYGCPVLRSVTGLTGLVEIGQKAFYSCSQLESVPLHEGLMSIGEFAFSYCSNLGDVTLPDSVTSVGWRAYWYCYGITNLTIGTGLSPVDGSVLTTEATNLITVTIHGTGTTEVYGFGGQTLQHLEMTGVKRVGSHAFNGCSRLETVVVDDSLEFIDEQGFHSCPKLVSVKGLTGLKNIGAEAFGDFWDYESDTSLSDIMLYEGLTNIAEAAFANNFALKKIVFPSTLRNIAYRGFMSCTMEQVVFLGPPPACDTGFGDSSCKGYYVGNTAAWQAALSGGKWHGMTMAPAGYVPEEIGGGKGILITEAWLDELDAEFGAGTSTTFKQKFGEDISTAIYELTGKVTIEREPKPVWHDYVTGTNPVDLNSLFRAFITMEGTTPNVTYDPVRADRVYRLWGTNDLGGEWVELAPGEEPDYHFFKATVEMP